MKTNYLLPHKFKTLGWILFILGIISGVIVVTNQYDSNALTIIVLSIYNEGSIFNKNEGFFKIVENSVLDEIIAIAIIVGGLIVGFTKEKVEDEFIYKLRKDSLVWAIIFNYVILLFAILFIYDFTFFDILVFNMFTPLIFFVVRFNFLKGRLSHEE
jgi:hypothetical protein